MKLYQNRAWLTKRYQVDGKNIYEIAAEAGCSIGTVQKYLEKFGLIFNPRKLK